MYSDVSKFLMTRSRKLGKCICGQEVNQTWQNNYVPDKDAVILASTLAPRIYITSLRSPVSMYTSHSIYHKTAFKSSIYNGISRPRKPDGSRRSSCDAPLWGLVKKGGRRGKGAEKSEGRTRATATRARAATRIIITTCCGLIGIYGNERRATGCLFYFPWWDVIFR